MEPTMIITVNVWASNMVYIGYHELLFFDNPSLCRTQIRKYVVPARHLPGDAGKDLGQTCKKARSYNDGRFVIRFHILGKIFDDEICYLDQIIISDL